MYIPYVEPAFPPVQAVWVLDLVERRGMIDVVVRVALDAGGYYDIGGRGVRRTYGTTLRFSVQLPHPIYRMVQREVDVMLALGESGSGGR